MDSIFKIVGILIAIALEFDGGILHNDLTKVAVGYILVAVLTRDQNSTK